MRPEKDRDRDTPARRLRHLRTALARLMAALRVTGSAEGGRPVILQSARRRLVLTTERQEEERLRRSALDGTWAEARPDDLSFRAAARRRQVQYGVPFRGEEHVIRAGPELDRRAGAVVFTCVLAVLPAEDGADWGIDPRPARMPYDHAWILWEDPVTGELDFYHGMGCGNYETCPLYNFRLATGSAPAHVYLEMEQIQDPPSRRSFAGQRTLVTVRLTEHGASVPERGELLCGPVPGNLSVANPDNRGRS